MTPAPSAPPRSPVEAARAAGIRWQAADQEFVRHQRVCRFWKAGRFCRACERLEIRTNFTSREYARALDEARRAGSR